MGHFQKVMLLLMVGTWAQTALAQEEAIPHFLKPGQVVSADILNEVFSAVKPDLATTFIGSWSTKCYQGGSNSTITEPIVKTGTLTITSSTGITQTGYSCITGGDAADVTFISLTPIGDEVLYSITYVNSLPTLKNGSPRLVYLLETNRIVVYNGGEVEEWTRLNVPPAIPTSLDSSVSEKVVTLTWKDNSTDETKFRLLRRDSLTGTFAEVSTPAANATTTTNTVTTAGTYWYRIQATNGNGNSLGSNLVKVTVP